MPLIIARSIRQGRGRRFPCKGRTIRKLMGVGEVQKNKFAQGKIKWKKVLARQLILKNIHAMA